jgi:glycosyltransferase involved in cell wall biosynthesis
MATGPVSVVIPSYNSAGSLTSAINSVRMQDWPGLEIIVVDDGSTDQTACALSSLRGPDLIVLTQRNQGPAAARNAGIRQAAGKWIAFLDADDEWLPGKLAAQMKTLEEEPSSAFSYTDAIRRSGRAGERLSRPRRDAGDIFWGLISGPQFVMDSVLVRRECFDEAGLFDPELRMGEDWDMWLRLADQYSSCYVPQALALCNEWNEPARYSSNLLERCTLRVLDRLFDRAEMLRRRPELAAGRRIIYSWHYSVLAKSHLRQRRLKAFVRLAAASVTAHYLGFYFLARNWSKAGELPALRHLVNM